MHKIKGIIYDLDGTIISTEKLHENGWKFAAKKCNVKITKQMLLDQKGMVNEAVAKMMLKDKSNLIKKFVKYKEDYVINHPEQIKIYDDFLIAYNLLTEKGLIVWICTSAPKEFVDIIYDKFSSLDNFKKKTLWSGMYKRGKPYHDSLLLTMEKMGKFKPDECVYIGDAFSDYMASQNANCHFAYFCKNIQNYDKRIPKNIPLIEEHTDILDILKNG